MTDPTLPERLDKIYRTMKAAQADEADPEKGGKWVTYARYAREREHLFFAEVVSAWPALRQLEHEWFVEFQKAVARLTELEKEHIRKDAEIADLHWSYNAERLAVEAERDEERAKRLRDNAYSFDRIIELEKALRDEHDLDDGADFSDIEAHVGCDFNRSWCVQIIAILDASGGVATSGQNKLHMTTSE